jgi:sugar phosphate isomerase/epimerase
MQFQLFKTLWGFTGDPLDALAEAAVAGFDGIEGQAPIDAAELERWALGLQQHGLAYIAEICTAGGYVPDRRADPERHLADLDAKLAQAAPLAPRFANIIGGCDAWPFAVQIEFFSRALEIAERRGVQCSFETHRSRSLFNPWITCELLARLPALRLTCDFSHWMVVCERSMDSEWDAVLEVARHAHHIHGRVGYDQGPQVPHPAAPEYAEWLAAHRRCWEAIWREQLRRGYSVSTMTPEFGPDGYLHCLPFTAAPVANLWQINRWMGAAERDHFRRFMAEQEQPLAEVAP